MLLMDACAAALRRVRGLRQLASSLDAKNERAAEFYRQFGFLDLPNVKGRLFLPMGTMETMFKAKG
jgi:hypothetical protein